MSFMKAIAAIVQYLDRPQELDAVVEEPGLSMPFHIRPEQHRAMEASLIDTMRMRWAST